MTASPSPPPSDPPEAAQVLASCPFCGGTSIKIRSNGIGDYYAVCLADDLGETDCGASTSDARCETEAGAIRRWNRRRVPPAADQVGEDAARELLSRYDTAAARARMVESPEAVREHNAARLALFKALAPQVGAGDRETIRRIIRETPQTVAYDSALADAILAALARGDTITTKPKDPT